MFSHHSDQMYKWSKVSKIALSRFSLNVFVVVFVLIRLCFLMTPISFARFLFGVEGRKALNPTQSIYIQGRPRAAWAAKKEDFEIPFPILWKHFILVESPPLEQKGIFCCGEGLRLCRRRASQSGRTAGSLPAGAAGGWLDLDTSRKAPQDVAPEIFPLPRHCAGALPSAPSVSSKTFRAFICFRCHNTC